MVKLIDDLFLGRYDLTVLLVLEFQKVSFLLGPLELTLNHVICLLDHTLTLLVSHQQSIPLLHNLLNLLLQAQLLILDLR